MRTTEEMESFLNSLRGLASGYFEHVYKEFVWFEAIEPSGFLMFGAGRWYSYEVNELGVLTDWTAAETPYDSSHNPSRILLSAPRALYLH